MAMIKKKKKKKVLSGTLSLYIRNSLYILYVVNITNINYLKAKTVLPGLKIQCWHAVESTAPLQKK